MGIQGLLPLLKSIERPFHLKDCAGMTLAVDGYVWLHKGAFACAQELCLGQPTQKYISYFMHRVQLFRHYGVTPFIVFDGGYLPSKASTETERLARREASKKKAMDLWQAERKKEALDQFRKCLDVTPEMAFAVIQALEAAKVEFIVAPYEADAQLAYLEKTGKVQGIVTEDSDLLVFGCKRMIFKLDQYGSGIEIQQEHLNRVQDVSFHNWSMTEIRHMCILSGCDYLPSIPGMGLKTAHRMLRRHKTYERVIKDVRMENTSVRVPANYEQLFEQADLTFLYARVYDMDQRCLVHLNDVPDDLKDLLDTVEYDFLGPLLSPEVAQGIATGRLNPITKEPLKLPSNARPLQLPKPLLSTGNNHKLAYAPQRPPVAASSKSIQSYFTKPTVPTNEQPSTAASLSLSNFINRKREQPVPLEASVSLKRLCSDDQATAEASEASPSLTCTVSLHKSTESSSVVVESKSRFFGFEAHEEHEEFVCDVVPESPLKQRRSVSTIREDSGVGLDEAQLQQPSRLSFDAAWCSTKLTHSTAKDGSAKIVYCEESDVADEGGSDAGGEEDSEQEGIPSFQINSSQLSSTDADAEDRDSRDSSNSSRSLAENSVIQGWRQRFSNPAATERSKGLTKAFEKMKQPLLTSSSSSKQETVRRRKAGSLSFSLPSSSSTTTSTAAAATSSSLPLSLETSSSSSSSSSSELVTGLAGGRGRGRPPLANRLSGSSIRTVPVVHVNAHEANYNLNNRSRVPLTSRANLPLPATTIASAGAGNKANKASLSSGKIGGTPGASLQQMLQLDRFKYTPSSSSTSS